MRMVAWAPRVALLAGLLLVLAVVVSLLSGCIRNSGGAWYVHSAERPEGWPELTPVGEVRVKEYPASRAAVVGEASVGGGEGASRGAMFRPLFNHIKDNDIAMTAPVEMGYAGAGASPRMTSMAFLYRRASQGEAGSDGAVVVTDLPAQRYASIGVRGAYTDARFARALGELDAWLTANADAWVADGPARYLGYNGPFTLWFLRYGEVQRPVVAVE